MITFYAGFGDLPYRQNWYIVFKLCSIVLLKNCAEDIGLTDHWKI